MLEVEGLEQNNGRRRSWPAWHHLVLIGILIIAALIRFWKLEQIPPPLHHDEAYNGIDALALLRGETFPIFHEGWELYAAEAHGDRPIRESKRPPFFEGNYGREPLLIYLAATSIGLAEASVDVLRFIPAIFGTAAILIVYLVARILSENLIGSKNNPRLENSFSAYIGPLSAAFAMAVFFPAVTLSRVGVREIIFVPIEGFTVYFLWKGIAASEHDKAIKTANQDSAIPPIPLGNLKIGWFAASGFFLGIGIYSYAAARFMPLLILAFFLIWWLQDRTVIKRYWANFLIVAGVSIVVSLPLLLFLLRQPYYLIYRSRFVANRGADTYPGQPWKTWALNIPHLVRGFIWRGDVNILNNLPGRPFLDPIQLVLVAIGTLKMLLNRFRLSYQFTALWLTTMILPGLFSGDAPHFGRLIGTAMPLVIILGIGVEWLYQLAAGWFLERQRILVLGSAIAIGFLLIASASLSLRDYFVRYADLPELSTAFSNDDWLLGHYAAALPDNAAIYLSPTQEKMATILFALKGQNDRLQSFFSPQGTLTPSGKTGETIYYLVREYDEATLSRISHLFPDGILDSEPTSFSAYEIDGSNRGIPGESDLDISWGGAISLIDWHAELSDQSLVVSLTWEAQVPMERSYTAFVHLLSEEGELVAQLDRLPDGYFTSDWQKGETIIENYQLAIPPDLKPGQYTIQSGFYYLPTQERLGEPQLLGAIYID